MHTCSAGSFSGVGAGTCTTCSAGTYASTDESAACITCDAGKFQNRLNFDLILTPLQFVPAFIVGIATVLQGRKAKDSLFDT